MSSLLDALDKCGSDVFWATVLPCFSCFSIFDESKTLKQLLLIVDTYGGRDAVEELARKIRHEEAIFTKARDTVNATIDPTLMKPKSSLLDVILDNNPRLKVLITDQIVTDATPAAYNAAIWQEYLQAFGNYHVIVYGLIEYLSSSGTLAHSTLERFTSAGAVLRATCLAHKAEALANYQPCKEEETDRLI